MAPESPPHRLDDFREILAPAEQIALQEVARRNGTVADLRKAQRDAAMDLILRRAGGDGANADDELEWSQPLFQVIDAQAGRREAIVGSATHVGNLPARVAAWQTDDNRRITFNAPMLQSGIDPADQAATRRHEEEHVRQETEEGESSETPDSLLRTRRSDILQVLRRRLGDDAERRLAEAERRGVGVGSDADFSLGRIHYRERGAIRAGEGEGGTSAEYQQEHVQTTRRVEERLRAGGVDGQERVAEAGRSREGYRTVRAELFALNLAEQLEKQEELGRQTGENAETPAAKAA